MKLLLVHGWGFDASLWDAMRAELREFDTVVWDRGYFGPASCELPEGPFVAVGHSLGSLVLALDPPEGCVGLVAVNGFDRFAGPGRVPARVVARMQAQFAVRPEEVLRDFRERVGAGDAPQRFDAERLSTDLQVLATADASTPLPAREGLGVGARVSAPSESLGWGIEPHPRLPTPSPSLAGRGVIVLHGAHDPLLPPEMRESVFLNAPRFTHSEAGHLLPLTHPRWCAEQVREVLAWA